MQSNKLQNIEIWKKFYGEILPLSYTLKYELSEKWFRIHSLKDAKRYPETKEEEDSIIALNNDFFKIVFNNCHRVLIVYAVLASVDGDISNLPIDEIYAQSQNQIIELYNLKEYIFQNHDEFNYKVYFKEVELENINFDIVFEYLADDKIENFFFMNIENGNIIAPYDGGTDLIISDLDLKDEIKLKYKHLLPTNKEGL